MAEHEGADLSRLPRPLTRLIGREREIVEIQRMIASSRLVTLTGAGGCGKTRLAIEVAAQLAPTFADGVCFIDLAPLADAVLVNKAVAAGLGLSEQPGRALVDALAAALRHRNLLLIMDNCEHLVQPCADLIDVLLGICDGLNVLATSRQVLRLSGETVWRVPSLGLPELIGPPGVGRAAQSEAVQLFIARAHAAAAGFALTELNVSVVASICHRLDGIPLALELAAARVAALGVEEIAARLVDRFGLLTGGSRTALPRQQTLRGTLDWSYELLSEPQRVLLRRLAVFAGGWTLEAAERVCGWAEIAMTDSCDLLAQLTDLSLVVAELQPKGGMRYRLLETVRQYAQLRLAGDDTVPTLRARHAEYYLELAEKGDVELRGSDQVGWLDRLEVEHDNLRAALAWSETIAGDADFRIRLAGALAWFWRLRSHFNEGRNYLRSAIASSQKVTPHALIGAGLLAFAQGDYSEASTVFEKALTVATQTSDRSGVGWALHGQARVAQASGDYDLSVALAEASLAAFRAIGDNSGIAYSLYYWARGLAERGELDRAAQVGAQSAALFRALGDTWGTIWVLIHLGHVAYYERDFSRAEAIYREVLSLSLQFGTNWGVHGSLINIAKTAGARGHPERATRLFGAAEELRSSMGLLIPVSDRRHIDGALTGARAAIGEGAFASAWAKGTALTLEQAITEAQKTKFADPVIAKPPDAPGGLSPREREVAELIAQGLSNRDIATALTIARRTADTHVGNVLTKLQLHTRAQVAVWAVEHRRLAT